jgi:hypothetical protein
MLGRRTAANGCSSLLPTPVTEPATANGHARNLGKEVLLATPRASEAEHSGRTTVNHDGQTGLAEQVNALLPSPRTSDANGAGAHGTGGPDLRTVVDLLPTPTAMDYKASGGSTSSDVTLTDAIVRTSLGAHMNPRFDGGNEPSDGEAPHLLSPTLEAGND